MGDLKFAERLWTEMIEKGEYINLVDYPDKALQSPPDNPDVFALLDSHLFCVDNLCDDEIRRARLAEERKFEGNPVRYKGQRLETSIAGGFTLIYLKVSTARSWHALTLLGILLLISPVKRASCASDMDDSH